MSFYKPLDLSTLNPQQYEAVTHKDGPLVIYSGAGSGKTRVICYRIAYLVSQGVMPGSIMAVTFTNKAAREMKERVEHLIGPTSRSILVSTFHSACARFLRIYAKELGYTDAFSIYDDDDQKALLKDTLKELEVPEKFLSPAILKSRIDALKNKGETPESYLQSLRGSGADNFTSLATLRRFGEEEHAEIIQKCYAVYQKKLKDQNAMDFNDLILLMVKILQEKPHVLTQLQNRFRYFLVDEFQDTNPIQFQLMKLLSSHTNNLCIVGDDDQSIYSWRGAEPSFILDFSKIYPTARVIMMEQNYRSSSLIVKAATGLIAHNVRRSPKKLWTELPEGNTIQVKMSSDAYEEAHYICNSILNALEKGARFSEFGILYRTNAQSRAIEDGLRKRMLPYVIYGSVRFYERAEIKSLLAYLRMLVNPDDDAAFQRVLAVPKRGFGDKAMLKLKEIASKEQMSLARTAARIARNDLSADIGRGSGALKEVTSLFEKWHAALGFGQNPSVVISDIISSIRFEEYLRTSYPEDVDDRWLNVLELRNALVDYEERVNQQEQSEGGERKNPMQMLAAFLEEAALVVEPTVQNVQTGNAEAITLMTIHSAKGLEFDRVFLAGLEEGILPHNSSLESDAAIEEERRLMYVAITRARKNLAITYIARNRYRSDMPAVPSRFVFEIPGECVQMEGGFQQPPRSRFDDGDVRYEPFADASWDDDFSSSRYNGAAFAKKKKLEFGVIRKDNEEETQEEEWNRGQHVQHKVFGVGVIQGVEKSLDGYRLQILFPIVGLKKVLHTFVSRVE